MPMLQRDYVQGSKEDVINPFLTALLSETTDLNYIYGYEQEYGKETCFVPVDGQQRLTTLWLLYLYVYAYKGQSENFSVKFRFISREYAQDFCERLQKHLHELLKPDDANKSLSDKIIDQPWFIKAWYGNATVRNMLKTLNYIHRKITDANIEDVWERLQQEAGNISFAFLNMDKSNGLDDDIYIKMNGRGRALSAFENLKSWMDEKISENKVDSELVANWKRNMDNAWTKLFWDNRNKNQEHPEEIDDEQLHCFYNMMILYHILAEDLPEGIQNIKESDPLEFKEMLSFLDIANESPDTDEVVGAIIEMLQKGDKFSLVWIDRLGLIPTNFYPKAYGWLESMVRYGYTLNGLSLYMGESEVNTTPLYGLSMTSSSIGRTLPLLYAFLCYKDGATTIFDWMRVMRNLILNTTIVFSSKDNRNAELKDIMTGIATFAQLAQSHNIYEILRSPDAGQLLKRFNTNQVKEEIGKAQQEAMMCYDSMTALENNKFFEGNISVLFRFLPQEASPGYDIWAQHNVAAYVNVLLEILDCNGTNGVNAKFNDDKHYLPRALMSFPPYRFGERLNHKMWHFCGNNIDDWRKYVKGDKSQNDSLRLLIKNVLAPAVIAENENRLESTLSEYVESVSILYEHDLEQKGQNTSYRFHLIHHPGVWDYMWRPQCALWYDGYDYDITLKQNTVDRHDSTRMELRTYCLFLDCKYGNALDLDGWKIKTYEYEGSCFYLDFKLDDENTFRIDVFFSTPRDSENCYSLNIRRRENDGIIKEDDNEKQRQQYCDANSAFIVSHLPELSKHGMMSDDGRFILKENRMSRMQMIDTLNKIMRYVASKNE